MQKPYLPNRNSIWVLRFDLKTTVSLLLLITAGFIMQAKESYSQSDKVSLDMKDVRVGDVLNYIESTTDYKFFFNTKTIDLDRTVSLKVSKLPIEKVMELLFDSRKTRVIIKDRTIILKQNLSTSSQETLLHTPPSKVQQEIGGNVTDASGVPLVGANIIEKGTNNGVTADFDGNFSIAISNQTAVLVVSYLGFDSKEVTVNAGETITVVLEESAAALDEVVVVGYGTQKKVNITGAITSINTAEINEVPTSNLSNTLAGRAPGVNITNTSGLAGASSSIRIRGGFGDPLYVIDGIVRDKEAFDALNANEVDQLSFLKDAATASIYGSRAGNGVVLVTTKKGHEQKPVFNFQTSYTTSAPTQTLLSDLTTATDELIYQNRVARFNGTTPPNGPEEFAYFENRSYNVNDMIWRNPSSLDYTMSVNGGGENITYFTLASYRGQEGSFK